MYTEESNQVAAFLMKQTDKDDGVYQQHSTLSGYLIGKYYAFWCRGQWNTLIYHEENLVEYFLGLTAFQVTSQVGFRE